jgi:DnaJ-class molecular chaperone
VVASTTSSTASATDCTSCEGKGGKTESSTKDGVHRETWHSCSACRGSGRR